MKHLLLITNGFPPNAGTESGRAARFAKYLPEHGWQPHVICSDWTTENCSRHDPNYGSPAVKQSVVGRVPPPRDLTRVSGLVNRWAKIARLLHGYRNPREWTDAVKSLLPDVLNRHQIDAVWATFPFRAPLHIADFIHQRWQIPWIADFRDVFEQGTPRPFHWWERSNEIRTVASASRIVTVSPALADVLADRHRRPVDCLPNGFDAADFERVPAASLPGFTILYAGCVHPPGSRVRTSPRVLFQAIDRLIANRVLLRDDVRLLFYGVTKSKLQPHLTGCQCEDRVECIEWIPRQEMYAAEKGATLLLLLGSDKMKGIMTAKVFEYLATGRPILAIPSDGDCIDALLEQTGVGLSASSVEEVANAVETSYRVWKTEGQFTIAGHADVIARYSCRGQTGSLANLLNSIVSTSHPTVVRVGDGRTAA